MQISGIATVLGGSQELGVSIDTPMDLIELSEKGVTKGALLHLTDCLGLSIGQMAQLLPVTARTIQCHSHEQRFDFFVSEHILQVAGVAARGTEAFGDHETFNAWLRHPSRALAQRTPMSMLRSRFGAQMVLEELGRIEYGLVS